MNENNTDAGGVTCHFFQIFLQGFFNFDAQATELDRKTDQISKQYFAFYVFQR
jgi:hypothetical protein